MKFLHLADAHLDSPFLGLSFLPRDRFSQIQKATNQAFENSVTTALKENVDLVLIAGDTFDSNSPSPKSQFFFANQVKRLTDAHIQVVMVFGNHDAMQPQNLLVTPSPYFKLLGADQTVASVLLKTRTGFTYQVNGFSYRENHITQDMIPEFPKKSSIYTFGLMHGALKSSAKSQNVYAPFTLREIQELNYDYFALGHIHKRQTLCTSPWVVYPGNMQGRHINESGAKGFLLGVIDESSHQTSISFHSAAPMIWQACQLTLSHPVDKATLQQEILETIQHQVKCTTLFRLTILGAQFLSSEETELLTDPEFTQLLSQSLPQSSLLVDVRFESTQKLILSATDTQAFDQAAQQVFTKETLNMIGKPIANKSEFIGTLLQDESFLKRIEAQARYKVAQRLEGLKQ